MPDPRFPFLPLPEHLPATKRPRSGGTANIHFPSRPRQIQRLATPLSRLDRAFRQRTARVQRSVDGAPVEQVLVHETIGPVGDFYRAVKKLGLEWLLEIDSEPTEPTEDFWDQDDREAAIDTRAYLVLSDQHAIDQILSQWNAYLERGRGGFGRGLAPWFHLFSQLKDVRLWDHRDQVEPDTKTYWDEKLLAEPRHVRTEIELWYSDSGQRNHAAARALRDVLAATDSPVLDDREIPEIRYRGLLVDLSIANIRAVVAGQSTGLTAVGSVMYFRPQLRAMSPPGTRDGTASTKTRPIPAGAPVVAVLDGVPLQNHSLLADRIVVDDPRALEARAPARDRIHGTSMTSIVLHGDLGGSSPTIPSRVLVHPILVPDQTAPADPRTEISDPERLLPDILHVAIRRIAAGEGGAAPTAPSVRVVNLSIGDLSREFLRSMSPLARLLDWLAWEYRLLFLVPTGNQPDVQHGIKLGTPRGNFAALQAGERAERALRSVSGDRIGRRLRSPGETLNGLTVGGVYADASQFQSAAGRFALYAEAWPVPMDDTGRVLCAPSNPMLWRRLVGDFSLRNSATPTAKPR